MDCQKLESVVARLETVATKLETISLKGGAGSQPSSAIVEEFAPLLSGPCAEFVQVCDKIGGEVKEAGVLFKKAFDDTYALMKVVSTSKKPSGDALKDVFKPLADSIEEIKKYASKNFKSEFKTHLEALSGYASCFAWVQAPSKPQAYIGENIDSGVFYANRVLAAFKEKGPEHKEFVQKLRACFEKLKEYAQEFHPVGITWNPQGSDAKAPQVSASATPAAATPAAAKPAVSASKPAANPGGLFAAINKGEGVTSKLKKVDDSQKTHKNPGLRAGAVVTEKEKKTPSPKFSQPAESSKPPKMELEGKKWAIENQRDQQMLEITDGDMAYSVYMYNCVNTNLVISNKLNVITFDKCHNCKVQMKSGLISSVEITNSKKIEVHADDVLPFVNINSTDGVQVFLNDKSVNTKVCTNTATAVNVCHWPEGGDLIEYPVPEVYVSYIKSGKLVNEVAESL